MPYLRVGVSHGFDLLNRLLALLLAFFDHQVDGELCQLVGLRRRQMRDRSARKAMVR